jgi:sulfatase modifying factor 1
METRIMRNMFFGAVCLSALLALPCQALPAEPKEIDHPDAGKLVLIPSGEFLMGSTADDADAEPVEKPQHRLEMQAFYMGIHEVTYSQFRKFVAASGYRTDAERNGTGRGYNSKTKHWVTANSEYNWRNTGFEQTEQHPVVNVSWNDAVAYCKWASNKDGRRTFRLPTEAEWEYACRAGKVTIYTWGNSPNYLGRRADNVADASLKLSISDSAKINNARTSAICESWDDRSPFSAPVGSFKKNQFGLYDMHGNVSEWCLDFFDKDQYLLGKAAPPATGTYRVYRGGNFATSAKDARSAKRDRHRPTFTWCPLGFRIASDAD